MEHLILNDGLKYFSIKTVYRVLIEHTANNIGMHSNAFSVLCIKILGIIENVTENFS